MEILTEQGMGEDKEPRSKLSFWSERATIGKNAGTNDFLLKGLEMELLMERITEGASVLDVGCGNGLTLVSLARQKNCTGLGIDFSEEMIREAKKNVLEHHLEKSLSFCVARVERLPGDLGFFDYVLTERCLINLDSEQMQHDAFLELMKHVKPGGRYLMIESFIQGLDRTNRLRISLGLARIGPPWHNVFLDEESVHRWETNEFCLEEIYPFSSTYYFLSRVVYAKIAQDRGEALRYDSEINLVATKLPPIGNFGPTRLWQWRRMGMKQP
jgi:ubiquinone/menaquinone biosynthesis C-methylase UbiE